jgi:hypothetical protein
MEYITQLIQVVVEAIKEMQMELLILVVEPLEALWAVQELLF